MKLTPEQEAIKHAAAVKINSADFISLDDIEEIISDAIAHAVEPVQKELDRYEKLCAIQHRFGPTQEVRDQLQAQSEEIKELRAACKRALNFMAGFTQHAAGTPSAKEQIEAALSIDAVRKEQL